MAQLRLQEDAGLTSVAAAILQYTAGLCATGRTASEDTAELEPVYKATIHPPLIGTYSACIV